MTGVREEKRVGVYDIWVLAVGGHSSLQKGDSKLASESGFPHVLIVKVIEECVSSAVVVFDAFVPCQVENQTLGLIGRNLLIKPSVGFQREIRKIWEIKPLCEES